jgi:branched-chain amino acid aminotransferase
MREKADYKAKYIWMDGKLLPWKDATVHVMANALHHGTAVFEGIRCYKTRKGPAVFRLGDHLARLIESAKMYKMRVPYSTQQLRSAVKTLIAKNGLSDCYIRPIAYYGDKRMDIDPRGAGVGVAIVAWSRSAFLGKEELEKGVRCRISSWRRISPKTVPTNAKASGYYINSAIAKMEAKDEGYDEAILLNLDGMVAEGSSENIFIVRKGELITPPQSAGILPGLTRDSLMRISKDECIPVKENAFTMYELYGADEAFLTGTAAGIWPIREVDGVRIGDGRNGPITKLLQSRYSAIVRGKDRQYAKWLDFVE